MQGTIVWQSGGMSSNLVCQGRYCKQYCCDILNLNHLMTRSNKWKKLIANQRQALYHMFITGNN